MPHTADKPVSPIITFYKRFRLFFRVIFAVVALSCIKFYIHKLDLEFLQLNSLFTSAISAAVFIIGFLLSSVLADYKESERMPSEMRVALEGIRDDAESFTEANRGYSPQPVYRALHGILISLAKTLNKGEHADIRPAITHVDELRVCFAEMSQRGMPPNFVVKLKAEQGIIRRCLFRMYHIQKIQFVPSVHILVQSLVTSIIFLMLTLETEGSPESALIFGLLSFMFIYGLYLINTLEQPFRKGRMSLDDVSLFLLREFEEKLEKVTDKTALEPTTKAD